jgi:ankyrin repeat protein
MLAVRNYHLEVVKMLVQAGADSEQQDKVSTITKSWYQFCKLLMSVHVLPTAGLMCCEQDGNTVLMWAAERGYLEVVKVLVQAGADKEKQDKVKPGKVCCITCRALSDKSCYSQNEDTALIKAAQSGRREVVVYLLQAGADWKKQGEVSFVAFVFICVYFCWADIVWYE